MSTNWFKQISIWWAASWFALINFCYVFSVPNWLTFPCTLVLGGYIASIMISKYRISTEGFKLGIHPDGAVIFGNNHRRHFNIKDDVPINVVYTYGLLNVQHQRLIDGDLYISVSFYGEFQPISIPNCYVINRSYKGRTHIRLEPNQKNPPIKANQENWMDRLQIQYSPVDASSENANVIKL